MCRPAWALALTFGLVSRLVLSHGSILSQDEIRYRTEANYLAHFASFVEWPANAFPDDRAPILLCLFGTADFGNSLQELTKDIVVKRRKIEVRSVKAIALARPCHILFIGREDAMRYGDILSTIRNLPILTVGESADFLDAGGAVNFVYGETLRIDIDLKAVERAHLEMSSNLLVLARRVINAPRIKAP
jgi:hypothetical protein